MKRFLAALAVAGSLGLAGGAPARAEVVTIGTNAQGSLAYIAGAAIARVARRESDLSVRTQALSGSTSYIPMVDRAEVDFGFASAMELIWAYTGTGVFEGRKAEDLRYVGMIFPLRSGLGVVADADITGVSQLTGWAERGKRLTTGYPSLKLIESYIAVTLDMLGLTMDDFVSVPVGGLTEGVEALGDGRADVTWVSLGSPAARQIDAELKSRGGWRYLDMIDTEEARRTWQEAFPGTRFVEMHAPGQPGVREPVLIQELPFMMVTHKDMSEETVHALTRLVAEHQPQLAEIMPTFRGLDPEEMASPGGLPYHPGAVRAYEELGIPVNRQSR